jgi:hypothetical protein
MKKIFKWIGLIILLGYMVALVMDKLDKRPFRFEDFKTAEALILNLKRKFTPGVNSQELLAELEASGAKCRLIDKKYYTKDIPENCEAMVFCKYNTGWLSYPPLIDYTVTIYANKEGKLLEFSVGKQYAGP